MDELLKLCEEAEAGPWTVTTGKYGELWIVNRDSGEKIAELSGLNESTAQLIAVARTLLPALLNVARSATEVAYPNMFEGTNEELESKLRDALAKLGGE